MRDPINSAALGQATAATQWLYAKANGRKGGKRSASSRRKKKASVRVRSRRAKSAVTSTSKRRRRRTGPARLVKGSPAARRHMARLRRMRRKGK